MQRSTECQGYTIWNNGIGIVYSSANRLEEMQGFANIIMKNQSIEQPTVYFNNDINTHAVYNAGN